MCYDVVSSTKKQIKYAKYHRENPTEILLLEEKLIKLSENISPKFHVTGFEHPNLLVFTDSEPSEPKSYNWGLIPFWVKDEKTALQIRNQTLNARKETLFEKPSFKSSVKNKRCLIFLDAFYEHHHFKGKTYPFHISMRSGDPIVVAGVWDEWVNKETGEIIKSVSIVTTEANELMSKIHNNPKLEGPRMPAILTKPIQDQWLIPFEKESDIKDLTSVLRPISSDELIAIPVHRLKGKDAIGNVPEAELEFKYNDLDIIT